MYTPTNETRISVCATPSKHLQQAMRLNDEAQEECRADGDKEGVAFWETQNDAMRAELAERGFTQPDGYVLPKTRQAFVAVNKPAA